MKIGKRMISLLLVTGLLLSLLPAKANASKPETSQAGRTIRIGYIDYDGFFTKHSDGSFTGYGVDYLNEISKYTGWNYEYVYDSWENLMKRVKTGDIDFICHAQKTPEREEDYLFSEYSDGSESSVLYARKEDERYYYNDFENFDGMKIAVLKDSFQNQTFAEYAHRQGFTFQFEEYPASAECFTALNREEVDAVAMGSLALRSDFRMICRFGSDPFYFISSKKNKNLMAELDDAMGQILGIDAYFQTDLYEKYYGDSMKFDILLTREEAEYIRNSKTITVGLLPDRKPLSYEDENGEPVGMTVDLMNLISEKSGLRFTYQFLEQGQLGYDFLSKGEGQLVAGVMASDFSHPNPDLLQSNSLQEGSIVFVGRSGESFNTFKKLTIALSDGFVNGESIIKEQYPNFQIYEAGSNENALNAIASGKADVMLQNMYVVRGTLQSPRYDQLEMFPAYSFPESMKVVAMPTERVLLSIINKSIASFRTDEENEVVINHTVAKVYKTTLSDVLYEFRYPLIGILVLFIICIIMSVIMAAMKQKNLTIVQKKNVLLAKAVAEADKANMSKSRFLAQMSHEIRTPMNAIIGLTTLSKNSLGDEERLRDYLGKIEGSSRLLLGIINDVLDMSAIESGKVKFDSAQYDLKKAITTLTSIFYQQAEQKNIDFNVHLKGVTEELVVGDELRVNQILMNLLSNAIKFTPCEGKVDFHIIQASMSHDKVRMRFVIKDTGCGMSEEMLERLFLPFEQESAKVARKYGGSGLGLSIAKQLTEKMGGTIQVESKVNVGTTFTVDIPFAACQQQLSTVRSEFSGISVLIVDDDDEALEYCGLLLERIGVSYEAAHSGEEALELLGKAEEKGNPFRLCMVDWKMPGMNGIELTRKIREIFGREGIIIVVSAYDLNVVEEKGLEAGVNYFMPKPLFQSTIYNALMRILHGAEISRESKPSESNYDFKGKKVLVAEDVALNLEVAVSLLKMVGLEVVCAEDGQQAVNLFLNNPAGTFDCILMDVNMPVMDGYEATREIRASKKEDAKSIPIYAMTANAFSTDITDALDAGMTGHIAKPIENEVLYKTLSLVFQKK